MSYRPSPDRNKRSAFTLVEVLIVVVIVLILAAVSAPSLFEAKVRSHVSTTRVRMEAMKQAMLAHKTDYGSVPADFNDPHHIQMAFRVRSKTEPVCSQTPNTNFATDGGLNFLISRAWNYANDMHCPLTTPNPYIDPMQTIDPFSDGSVPFGYDSRFFGGNKDSVILYGVYASAGPDLIAGQWLRGAGPDGKGLPYSPTNGTSSLGEFWGVIPNCLEEICMEFVLAEFSSRDVFPDHEPDLNSDGNINDLD